MHRDQLVQGVQPLWFFGTGRVVIGRLVVLGVVRGVVRRVVGGRRVVLVVFGRGVVSLKLGIGTSRTLTGLELA